MTKTAAPMLLGILLLATLAPLASAAPTTFSVNVVTARSLGCSPDSWTEPDLRVRVYVNDVAVLSTLEASDQDEPTFGVIAVASANLPATIAVEADEGEPSGFFGLGTTYVPCAMGPGGATRATFTYNGESALAKTVRGEGAKAAEVTLVVGTNPPPKPTLSATSTESSVTLNWTADPTGQAVTHRVAYAGAGAVLRDAQIGATTATVTNLCDNMQHALRVIRDASTWRVTSDDVQVKTKNLAPWPPTVLSATRAGNVSIESRTRHDAATFQIHASASSSFAPNASTLRATTNAASPFPATEATGVKFAASDSYVVVRLVDTGGLHADSATFLIDSPKQNPTVGLGGGCPAPPQAGSTPPTQPTQPTQPQKAPDEPAPQTPPTPPASAAFDVRLTSAAPGGELRAKIDGTLDVRIENKGAVNVTLDLVPTNPAKSAAEQATVVLATIKLAVGETKNLSLSVPTPPRTPRGEHAFRLEARIRETSPNTIVFSLPFTLEVPLQAWELAEEDLRAWFEVKGAGGRINASPGGAVKVPVTLVNKADHALHVSTWLAPSLVYDEDIGRSVVAHGFEAAISTPGLTLDAYSKSPHSITVHVPANATLGSVVTAQVGITVNNTEKETTIPTTVEVLVVAAATVQAHAGLSTNVLIAAGLAAGATLAGAGAWILRRDATRFAIAAALYTRLAKSDVLNHPARDDLKTRIGAAPGITYSQLQRDSGLNTGALIHHLRALEKAGIVTSRKEGAYRRFYPIGEAPRASGATTEFTVSPLTPMQATVLEALQAAPLTQSQLAEKLGLSQQGVSYHVKTLERAGHIEAEYDGRVWRYKPARANEVVRP